MKIEKIILYGIPILIGGFIVYRMASQTPAQMYIPQPQAGQKTHTPETPTPAEEVAESEEFQMDIDLMGGILPRTYTMEENKACAENFLVNSDFYRDHDCSSYSYSGSMMTSNSYYFTFTVYCTKEISWGMKIPDVKSVTVVVGDCELLGMSY